MNTASRVTVSRLGGLALVGAVAVQACTSENVTAVSATAVNVLPPSVSTVAGERVQFSATIVDERQRTIGSPPLTWTTDDARVASVNEDGAARALSPGIARIRASLGDVSGIALFRVVDTTSAPPDPDPIDPDPDDPDGPDDGGSGGGGGEGDGDDGAGDIEVVESDGVTVVTELLGGGNVDALLVTLTRRPVRDVIVSVVSADLGEVIALPAALRFTPSNWAVPQTVTATGVDDLVPDGDQETIVTLAVVDLSSDPDFGGIVRRIRVTIVDDGGGGLGLVP